MKLAHFWQLIKTVVFRHTSNVSMFVKHRTGKGDKTVKRQSTNYINIGGSIHDGPHGEDVTHESNGDEE